MTGHSAPSAVSCRAVGAHFRWACRSEVLAPKAGNVYPGAEFDDLGVNDFLIAADCGAKVIDASVGVSLGETIYRCVASCAQRTQSNANLGIILLLVPLAKASVIAASNDRPAECSLERLRDGLCSVLGAIDAGDSVRIFDAIALAHPGGMGKSVSWDVNQAQVCTDIIAAMELARDRDQIALQYCTGFSTVFDTVAPLVKQSIESKGTVAAGITEAQIALLSQIDDSLIARKCGPLMAQEARRRAQRVARLDAADSVHPEWQQFDTWLLAYANRRNPGTTADMIAAGLFVLAQTQQIEVSR